MTTATPTPKTIHELRKHDGPLYIANNSLFKITFREQLGDKRVDFELDPKGEVDSVRMLPTNLALEMRGLQKLWLRGTITISTDEGMEDQIALLINQNIQAPQDRLDAIMARGGGEGGTAVLENSASAKSLVEKACLECGRFDQRTGVIVSGRVVQSVADDKVGVPPLCTTHAHMATQFIARAISDGEGNQTWQFDKVTVTAPVRGATS